MFSQISVGSSNLQLSCVSLGPVATNTYVISCLEQAECAIIDPAMGALTHLIEYIEREGITPVAILLTHSHWDHIVDCNKVRKHYQIPVFIHPLDQKNLLKPGSDKIVEEGIDVEPCKTFQLIDVKKQIRVGSLRAMFIHTPGHSPGSGCFYFENEGVLISGDTLFKGAVGMTDIPGGSNEALLCSLDVLFRLPSFTRIFPGHGKETLLEDEKKRLSCGNID